MVWSQTAATSTLPTGASSLMEPPAQLNRVSSLPNWRSTAVTAAFTLASSVTSVGRNSAAEITRKRRARRLVDIRDRDLRALAREQFCRRASDAPCAAAQSARRGRQGAPRYSALMLAALITGAHFAISDLMFAA